jgi:hypothetical protein
VTVSPLSVSGSIAGQPHAGYEAMHAGSLAL